MRESELDEYLNRILCNNMLCDYLISNNESKSLRVLGSSIGVTDPDKLEKIYHHWRSYYVHSGDKVLMSMDDNRSRGKSGFDYRRDKELRNSSRLHPVQRTKYDKLYEYLCKKKNQNIKIIILSFSEIENIIEDDLPKGARTHKSWWSNNGSAKGCTQNISWLYAGYNASPDISKHEVQFHQITESIRL